MEPHHSVSLQNVALESIDVRENCANESIDERVANLKVEESDSTDDKVPSINTIGNVPLEWYEDEEHIGYDISGKKIKKQPRKDRLDAFLAETDDSKNWRRIYDEYNDEEVELTKEETKIIHKLLRGKTPHTDVNPYEPYVDLFDWEGKGHPLSTAPEPKRRFIPSKWEHKKVILVVIIPFSGLQDETSVGCELMCFLLIVWIGMVCAGHEWSYRPSVEYVPTQEEIESYELMLEEDRPKFVPRGCESLRHVPAYVNLKEYFDRCLDLYLCPRILKKRLHIDPEALKPKLPSKKDLQPYPSTCFLEYTGHTGPVASISIESSGQLIASGSIDGTVRIWEIETGRCLRDWRFNEPILHVAWNPISEFPILAVAAGQEVVLLNASLGNPEDEEKVKDLLHVSALVGTDESSNKVSHVSWARHDTHDGIKLKHFKCGRRCHQLNGIGRVTTSQQLYQMISLAEFFFSLKSNNVIVGSKEGKLCWFDMDLSSQPYLTLRDHYKDINNVTFHCSYPLFASCSDDCTAIVFHGMVYSELNESPLIVPL
ncbi:Ribosome biogenesis BOP1-like protein [Nymphaea thermarum]|nr:Ribosome biogenesis BOP1-like protein [Nymphaea thermarum]